MEIPYHGQDLAFSVTEFWVISIYPFGMPPWTARNKTNGKDRGVGKKGAILTCCLLSPAFVSIPFTFRHFVCVLKPQEKPKCLGLTYLWASVPSEVCLQQQELHQLGTSKCLETARRRMETSQITGRNTRSKEVEETMLSPFRGIWVIAHVLGKRIKHGFSLSFVCFWCSVHEQHRSSTAGAQSLRQKQLRISEKVWKEVGEGILSQNRDSSFALWVLQFFHLSAETFLFLIIKTLNKNTEIAKVER